VVKGKYTIVQPCINTALIYHERDETHRVRLGINTQSRWFVKRPPSHLDIVRNRALGTGFTLIVKYVDLHCSYERGDEIGVLDGLLCLGREFCWD
jgi:hypothetical protein